MDIKFKKFHNWSLTHNKYAKIFTPKNYNELKKFILLANKKKLKIIPKGAALSYNDQIFLKNGIIIDLKNINKIIKINYRKRFVQVECGCSLGNIIKKINKKNFTIGAIPGSENITVGGAITNNVHGKDSKHFGSFVNNLIEIKVLLTNGKDKIIKKKDIPKILNFGLFYIIKEAKLNLIKISSNKVMVKKFYFQNIIEMSKIIKKKNYPFMYGWIDFYSRNNAGYIEVGNYYKTKIPAKDYFLLNSFLYFFNNLSIISKYFVNKFSINLLNKIIIFFAKNFKDQTKSLYNFYFPLKNVALNKFFVGGIVELQILIKEDELNKNFILLKKIIQKYNIPSYFMGIKPQKNQDLALSFYKKGLSFSFVFPKKEIHNINFKKFIFSLKRLINKKKIFLNLTKDFLNDNLYGVKTKKRTFLKYKKIYDKNNLLFSDFAKRHNLFIK